MEKMIYFFEFYHSFLFYLQIQAIAPDYCPIEVCRTIWTLTPSAGWLIN